MTKRSHFDDPPLVTIFLPSLSGGGAERVMVELANAFVVRGMAVHLVLSSATGPYLDNVSAGVKIIDLAAGRVIKALVPLVRYLRKERPFVMLSAMGHANVVALLARLVARVPTRIVVSERSAITQEYARRKRLSEHVNYRLIRWLYPTADGICSVSESASKELAKFTGLPLARIQTIYNPFDLSRISRLACQSLDHPWFLSGQPPVIVAAGRLDVQKDYPTLLQAFARLRQSRDVRLIILGEGVLRRSLETLAINLGLGDDVLQMPGFVSNPFSWLARCRLFVLCSRWEGLPGVLIEAMACGVPVVSTDCLSGPAEILEDGRWGTLVPVGDVEALTAAMMVALDTPLQDLPDVHERAADFEQERAVDAYLRLLDLPLRFTGAN